MQGRQSLRGNQGTRFLVFNNIITMQYLHFKNVWEKIKIKNTKGTYIIDVAKFPYLWILHQLNNDRKTTV